MRPASSTTPLVFDTQYWYMIQSTSRNGLCVGLEVQCRHGNADAGARSPISATTINTLEGGGAGDL